jgi:hypothetical protein
MPAINIYNGFVTVITLLFVPTLYTSLESAKLRLGFKPDRLTGIMEER